MPNELVDLHIDEISAVGAGANRGARVVLLKSKRIGKKGFLLDGEGSKVRIMDNPTDDERVGLVKQIIKWFGVDKDDLDLDEEAVVDKEEKQLLKELKEQVTTLETAAKTADAVAVARDEISKAKSPEEVDVVVAKIEDEEVLKAVTDRASERKVEFEKSAGEAEVLAFRAGLPEPMHKGFDELDADARAAFMKNYSDPGTDPMAKALEAMTEVNKALAATVGTLQESDELRVVKEELKDLDGFVDDVGELAKTIVKLRKHDADAANSMLEKYRALAKQAETAGLFTEAGKTGGPAGDAQEKIDKLVKARRDTHPEESEEVAMTKVLEDNKDLYTESLADEKE